LIFISVGKLEHGLQLVKNFNESSNTLTVYEKNQVPVSDFRDPKNTEIFAYSAGRSFTNSNEGWSEIFEYGCVSLLVSCAFIIIFLGIATAILGEFLYCCYKSNKKCGDETT
jgi:hypothetical protein